MLARRVASALVIVLAGCLAPSDRAPSRAPALRDPQQVGAIANRNLVESSGFARSTRHPGLFWSHNDSGNDPLLFALDSTGHTLGEWSVTGAKNTDWEAIAVGPCVAGAGGSCIYLGDVGDNFARRDAVVVWRFGEPPLDSLATGPAESMTFRYADGARDVEAMWMAPDTSLWLVTKRPLRDARDASRPSLLYRVPASAWHAPTTEREPAVAELVDSIPIVPRRGDEDTWVTDASLDRDRVAIRTYGEVLVMSVDAATGRPRDLVARCSLRGLRERNGEAVGWLGDDLLLFGSEGAGSRLWTGRCP